MYLLHGTRVTASSDVEGCGTARVGTRVGIRVGIRGGLYRVLPSDLESGPETAERVPEAPARGLEWVVSG